MKCPKCGGNLVLKKGRYGEFYGCSNFPTCKYSEGADRPPPGANPITGEVKSGRIMAALQDLYAQPIIIGNVNPVSTKVINLMSWLDDDEEDNRPY